MNSMKVYYQNKEIPSAYWLFVCEYAWDQNISPRYASRVRCVELERLWVRVKGIYMDVVRILKARLASLKDASNLDDEK